VALRRPGDLDRASLLAAEAAQHLELLATYVQMLVSRALGVPPARIDREQPLPDLGLDSIMSMEVRSALQRAMDVQVPVAVLLKGPSANQLARYVLDRLHA
jgi:acyl carrier protein